MNAKGMSDMTLTALNGIGFVGISLQRPLSLNTTSVRHSQVPVGDRLTLRFGTSQNNSKEAFTVLRAWLEANRGKKDVDEAGLGELVNAVFESKVLETNVFEAVVCPLTADGDSDLNGLPILKILVKAGRPKIAQDLAQRCSTWFCGNDNGWFVMKMILSRQFGTGEYPFTWEIPPSIDKTEGTK